MDLAKEQKLNYGDDMASFLRQARKKRFQIKEEQRINQEIELQTYLNSLIVQDAEKSLAQLKEKECSSSSQGEAASMDESKLIIIRQEIEEKRDNALNRLNELFYKMDENRRVCINLKYTFELACLKEIIEMHFFF